jgi:hypothetical protein
MVPQIERALSLKKMMDHLRGSPLRNDFLLRIGLLSWKFQG